MDRLEKRIMELFPETEFRYQKNDLLANGYQEGHHSFRKQVDGTSLMVYWRQVCDTPLYEFGGIIPGHEVQEQ